MATVVCGTDMGRKCRHENVQSEVLVAPISPAPWADGAPVRQIRTGSRRTGPKATQSIAPARVGAGPWSYDGAGLTGGSQNRRIDARISAQVAWTPAQLVG